MNSTFYTEIQPAEPNNSDNLYNILTIINTIMLYYSASNATTTQESPECQDTKQTHVHLLSLFFNLRDGLLVQIGLASFNRIGPELAGNIDFSHRLK